VSHGKLLGSPKARARRKCVLQQRRGRRIEGQRARFQRSVLDRPQSQDPPPYVLDRDSLQAPHSSGPRSQALLRVHCHSRKAFQGDRSASPGASRCFPQLLRWSTGGAPRSLVSSRSFSLIKVVSGAGWLHSDKPVRALPGGRVKTCAAAILHWTHVFCLSMTGSGTNGRESGPPPTECLTLGIIS